MPSLPILSRYGYPVVYDATHSVRLPGAGGRISGGQRWFVASLAGAAAAGYAGFFLEAHAKPERTLSAGPNMIDFVELTKLSASAKETDSATENAD